ncbi:MAG: hypothetical protein HYX27_06145 [Acidobacteria bacterium]|nr:hypothetical protein [Acidobacteriota bacterium]
MGHDPVLRRRAFKGAAVNSQAGQAIIMVTLALVAMCGLLGLAVDFGWAYFVKRAAQGAADAAALAAAEEMRKMQGVNGTYTCLGGGGTCRTDFICTPGITNDTSDNLDNACLYARYNGFQETSPQRVRIAEGVNGVPPTLPAGVTMQYWATVRISETVPQLFAAITGNPMATVSARATAGIYFGQATGSIYVINRDNDVPDWSGGGNPTGQNIVVGGSASVTAGGGVFMASSCAGSCGPGNTGNYAGDINGSGTVTAPYTWIRGAGDIPAGDYPNWDADPVNGKSGNSFLDPTREKPPMPVVNLTGGDLADCPVDGGVIAPSTNGGTVDLGPGRYYATVRDNKTGIVWATGNPVQFTGNINFRAGGACQGGGISNPTGFSTYVFYGGLAKQNGAASMTLESGQIVMAGVAEKSGRAGVVFDVSGTGGFTMTGPGQSAAGNVFIFTDLDYGHGMPPLPDTIRNNLQQPLYQGSTGFKSGSTDNVSYTLDGLNQYTTSGTFPTDLKKYDTVVMWQDRRNSAVKYNASDGYYNCLSPYTDCTKIQSELDTDHVRPGSSELNLAAGANTIIRGMIYQPRGGWAVLQGSPGMSSPIQIVTGAIKVQGSGTVILSPVLDGLPQSIVGLVE